MKIVLKIFLCVLAVFGILAVVFVLALYWPTIFPEKFNVLTEKYIGQEGGYHFVRISSDKDLFDLRNESADFLCVVHSGGKYGEIPACELLMDDELKKTNGGVFLKISQLEFKGHVGSRRIDGRFHYTIKYKKISSNKVDIELCFTKMFAPEIRLFFVG